MKFKGVTPHFKCSMSVVSGHVCSPERGRWASNGFWSDVCQAAMDQWITNTLKEKLNPWTGRPKEAVNGTR